MGPDSVITVFDAGRRRMLRYELGGALVADRPLAGGIWGHKAMGKILATNDALIDYWFADKVGDWYVSDSLLESAPLIEEVDIDGIPTGRGWGRPTAPADSTARALRWLLQEGDAAVWRDSLFVLRHSTATIEVYALDTPSRAPLRVLALRRYRRAPVPSEEGAQIFLNFYGEPKASSPRELEYETLTSTLAVSQGGMLYVVSRLSTPTTASSPWPKEALTIYDREGHLHAGYALTSRSSVSAGFLDDGSFVVLGNPTDEPGATYAIQFFRLPGDSGRSGMSCGWSI